MSDTPRTDEALDHCNNCGINFVLASDMEKLERELAEANEERAPMPRSEVIDRLREHAESAEHEAAELRAALRELVSIDDAKKRLAKIGPTRDDAFYLEYDALSKVIAGHATVMLSARALLSKPAQEHNKTPAQEGKS